MIAYRYNGTFVYPTPLTPAENALAEELIAYWLSFVRDYNPNTYRLPRSPEWHQFTPESRNKAVLTKGTPEKSAVTVEVVSEKEYKRCQYFASIYEILED